MLQHGGQLQIIERARGIGRVIEIDTWLWTMAGESECLLAACQCLFDGRRLIRGKLHHTQGCANAHIDGADALRWLASSAQCGKKCSRLGC